MIKAIQATISGRVQGVFFRASTQKVAQSLNLQGWVKNLSDGRVRVLAQGSAEQVDELIQWCHQGPAQAKVTEVELENVALQNLGAEFEVLR